VTKKGLIFFRINLAGLIFDNYNDFSLVFFIFTREKVLL